LSSFGSERSGAPAASEVRRRLAGRGGQAVGGRPRGRQPRRAPPRPL